MEFQITSDLHMECGRMDPFEWLIKPAADILVIAGDLCHIKKFESGKLDRFIDYINNNWKKVIWVPGNHDYCGMAYGDPDFEYMFHTIEGTNIEIAHNHTVVVDDVNFVCSTLWSYIPPQYEVVVKMYLNDFHEIGNFNPLHYNRLNAICQGYLRHQIGELDRNGAKIVVVTHHLPTWSVVSDHYRNDDCTYGFANTAIDDLILDYDVSAWVHGHSHDAREDDLGGTLVVRNPVGYPRQRNNTSYSTTKVINV